MSEIFERYRTLRSDVDHRIKELLSVHASHLHCQPACTGCCINLTVWPVEFFAILDDLQAAQIKLAFDPQTTCGFLKDGLCQIYPFRPIICRTHGLPLVYLDDEQDEPAYGVTFCRENFQDADDVGFDADNTLNMDTVNETLAGLHTAFLDAGGRPGPDTHGRIALARLIEYL